jgi:hypothetical protein
MMIRVASMCQMAMFLTKRIKKFFHKKTQKRLLNRRIRETCKIWRHPQVAEAVNKKTKLISTNLKKRWKLNWKVK